MNRADDRRQKMRERLQRQLLDRETQSNASPNDRIQKCEQDLSFLMEGLTRYFNFTIPPGVFLYPVVKTGPGKKKNPPSATDAIIEWPTIMRFLNREWTQLERHFLAGEGQGQTWEREIVPGNVPVRNFMAEGMEKWKRLKFLAKDLPENSVIRDPARLHIFPSPRGGGEGEAQKPGVMRTKQFGR